MGDKLHDNRNYCFHIILYTAVDERLSVDQIISLPYIKSFNGPIVPKIKLIVYTGGSKALPGLNTDYMSSLISCPIPLLPACSSMH